MPIVHCRPT